MAVKKREIPKPPTATVATTSARGKSARSTRATPAPAAPKVIVPAKNFVVEEWKCEDEGKRILIYAESGMGKTTLASLAPGPVFIGIDDGGKLIKDESGKKLQHVPDVSTFTDVRGALQAPIYANDKTIVVDQATYLEEWAVDHVLATITNEKGNKMDNITRYGYNKGYRHLYDTMKLVLQDCDVLIRQGKNIIIIAQMTTHKIANPGGEDFLRAGPRLYGGTPSIEALYCEWADHVFQIGYQFLSVDKKKVTSNENMRAIFVHPQPHYRAKSRTLGPDKAVVSFEDPTDDSIWVFLFGK